VHAVEARKNPQREQTRETGQACQTGETCQTSETGSACKARRTSRLSLPLARQMSGLVALAPDQEGGVSVTFQP
jgi:hypothetical protein